MDTDGSRRRHIQDVIINLLSLIIFISYKLNFTNVYFISNSTIVNTIKETLFKEGYYIEKHCKGVYKLYPILYGERK